MTINTVFSRTNNAAAFQNKARDHLLDLATNKMSAEDAQKFRQKIQELDDSVNMLRNGKSNTKEQAKGAAKQKIEALKAQLRMLRMMGGDPKTVARQAARLARELAAAVRQYASASGGTDIGAASSAPPATDAQAATATEETAQVSTPTTASPLPAVNDEDAAFKADVKKMVEELKNLLRRKKTEAEKDQDPATREDMRKAEEAFRDITGDLSSLDGTLPTGVNLII